MVDLLFFGATADIIGQRKRTIDASGKSAQELLSHLVGEYPALRSHALHLSINQEYSQGTEIINDGDEVAIFTAVSGG